ncbi:MAG TPA: ABC transporter ATP-binding protein [Micropepsaceae bacterium]|nr:ABC transporter ATP-binding protein [Micropepsaceae bacterium]
MHPFLTVESLRVEYGGHAAVQDMSFAVERGEFLTLLGPSGCGKTTTLRAIAGFVTPAAGRILVNDQDITALPAHRRNIGVVFQSYALFPHLTVHENVAFGLRMRHVAKGERNLRAADALAMVGLTKLAGRYPAQLSGGQQQRVALARALVIEPAILLLDEPLSNLDANLRAELRQEIRALQSRLKITTILVTHDQQEALAVSDRVAIMNEGRIADIGTPEALCDRPGDPFAAAFMGARTIIAGQTREGIFEAPGLICHGAPETATRIVLRGARLSLNNAGGPLFLSGTVASRIYLGDCFETDVETASGRIRIIVPSNTPPPAIGEACAISALAGGVSFMSSGIAEKWTGQ